MTTKPAHWVADTADRLRRGQVGVVPFDTVLGITATISAESIQRIRDIKLRPATMAFIVIINHIQQLTTLCTDLSAEQMAATQRYWPGPVTLILPKSPQLPPSLTGEFEGIGIRLPTSKWVTDLVGLVGAPLISTSANRHGKPGATSIADLDPDIRNAVDFTVSATVPMTGAPSKIIDCVRNTIIRP